MTRGPGFLPWPGVSGMALLPQLVALNLAGGGLGKFGDEVEGARTLIGREIVPGELAQCFLCRGTGGNIGLEDDVGDGFLQTLLVFLGHHRCFGHGGMAEHCGFDLTR